MLYFVFKRTLDFGISILIIVLFWWLLLLITLLIKVGSPGPAILAQNRIGLNQNEFVCFKFRTMQTGTKVAATHEVSAKNITGIGHFLRKSKLDELPQIWNIIKNEMSFIGPRPCLPNQRELIKLRTDAGIFDDLPGITGWAQVRGIDMSDPQRLVTAETEYKMRRSISVDIKILLATFIGNGNGDRTHQS
ncbi:MAG: sugar transferase [Rhizobiaceae bacterium]|nr:sugar transferase [Rhizobiaceae bacterium]